MTHEEAQYHPQARGDIESREREIIGSSFRLLLRPGEFNPEAPLPYPCGLRLIYIYPLPPSASSSQRHQTKMPSCAWPPSFLSEQWQDTFAYNKLRAAALYIPAPHSLAFKLSSYAMPFPLAERNVLLLLLPLLPLHRQPPGALTAAEHYY